MKMGAALIGAIAVIGAGTALAILSQEGNAPARKAVAATRAVTPSPALCELVFAIGAGDRLVGVSRFCDEPAAARSLPNIGGILDPNLEEVARLRPDTILLQGKIAPLESLAAQRGWAVESFSIETVADVISALDRLGAIFDRKESARAEAEKLRSAFARARERAPAERPRALVSINRTPGDLGSVASIGTGTFLSECIDAAGAVNVFADLPRGYPMVQKEAIVARAPKLVIELRSDPCAPEVERALASDWSSLGAPRVVVIAGSETLVPGPRLARFVERLSAAARGEP